MSIYTDASALMSLFVPDEHSNDVDGLIRAGRSVLMVSDFAAAEFSSAVAMRVRMQRLTGEQARTVLLSFDRWREQDTQSIEVSHADIEVATGFLRRFDLKLRTPDAVHIAIAHRHSAQLLTFDRVMKNAARTLGLDVMTA